MNHRYLRWDGNPNLRTSRLREVACNLSYGWLSWEVSYSRVYARVFEVARLHDDAQAIVLVAPMNLPDHNQYFTALAFSPKIWHLSINGQVGVQLQDLHYNGPRYTHPFVAYSLRVRYAVGWGWNLRPTRTSSWRPTESSGTAFRGVGFAASSSPYSTVGV